MYVNNGCVFKCVYMGARCGSFRGHSGPTIAISNVYVFNAFVGVMSGCF